VPRVTCGLHSIRVDVDTERPFVGKLYVKGESDVKTCGRHFGTALFGPGAAPIGPGVLPVAPVVPFAQKKTKRSAGFEPLVPLAPVVAETVGMELAFGQCHMRRIRTVIN